MDAGTMTDDDFWRRKAGQLKREHPVHLAIWHLANFVANLAIRVQDEVEAYLRKVVGEP